MASNEVFCNQDPTDEKMVVESILAGDSVVGVEGVVAPLGFRRWSILFKSSVGSERSRWLAEAGAVSTQTKPSSLWMESGKTA